MDFLGEDLPGRKSHQDDWCRLAQAFLRFGAGAPEPYCCHLKSLDSPPEPGAQSSSNLLSTSSTTIPRSCVPSRCCFGRAGFASKPTHRPPPFLTKAEATSRACLLYT